MEPVRTFVALRRFIATQRLTVGVYGQPEGAERQDQRARATASREIGAISLRALRCMR